MKRIKLTIDNQEFELDVDAKQVKKITDSLIITRNGYEQSNQGFYVSARGDVFEVANSEDAVWEVGNYYNSRKLAEDCARADRLMRLLRRFSVEHRTSKLDLDSECWTIQYLRSQDSIIPYRLINGCAGAVLFDSEEHAAEAIRRYKNDLMWYFKQFKDTTQQLYI